MQGLGERVVVNLDVPQTVISFGSPGIGRHDPDFFTAYVVNHILGGGSHTSRLYREVREKRGLAYGIRSNLIWMEHANVVSGGTATQSARAAETLAIIDQETRELAADGPTQDELDKAKAFLKGSYALAFDTSARSPGRSLQIQLDKLGIDYPERRNALIDAVTLADAKARGEAPARHQGAHRCGRPRPGADQDQLTRTCGTFGRRAIVLRYGIPPRHR
jgi:zinc protease